MLSSIIRGGSSARDIFINLVAYICAIAIAIMFHEFAHGFIALKNGDYTAKAMGRLTLNPVKHFDIFGIMMFVVVGIGWAKPVPVNPNNFKSQKKGIFTVAIAGVTTNLIIATISAGFLALIGWIATAANPEYNSFVYVLLLLFLRFFMYSLVINISLIAFNLIPIFPLDGFRVVEAFAKPNNKYLQFMYRYGTMVLFGLLIFSSVAGMLHPYLNIFGMYMGSIQNLFLKLFSKIFNLLL